MIIRQASKILRNFGRLIKPKISAHENIFELIKDKTTQLKFIENYNNNLLNTTKDFTFVQLLNKKLNISEKSCEAASNTVINTMAYSPIWMKPYRISQKLNGQVQIEDNPNSVQIPYNPGQSHIKYHYSIERPVRITKQLQIKDKQTAYMFNLPENITLNQIVLEIGYRAVKVARIQRCMLGLPAYAVIQFHSQSHLTGKFNENNFKKIQDKTCHIVTHADAFKLDVKRRQLVLKGLNQNQTPSELLIKLSQFGKILDLNLPMEIYRQPSLQQIKQLYKDEKNPICINYHRKNGTIESQYYPQFKQARKQRSYLQNKEEEYKRRLRYCQNVDVYEGQQGKIKTKAKGFCIVTFSCQQQAQNCYLHLGKFMKMQLVNGRQQFEFDQKHRMAILRHIDNSYIETCLKKGPYSDKIQQEKKKEKKLFQTLFMNNIRYKSKAQDQMTLSYINHINQLRESIGMENIKDSEGLGSNLYGKSFDDLAEDELYGEKLDKNRSNKRYKVNIDQYMKQRVQIQNEVKKVSIQQIQRRQDTKVKELLQQIRNDNQNVMNQLWNPEAKFSEDKVDQQTRRGRNQHHPGNKRFAKQKVKKRLNKLSGAGGGEEGATKNQPQKGKGKFSSNKQTESEYRGKTEQQKMKSHMKYNKYMRDTINQYMGVFTIQKLQNQFYKKKPTFINPQNLKFNDGSQFITQQSVKSILEFSTNQKQDFYDLFVKQNEIVKSLNLDVQELILKNLQENQERTLQHYTDYGIIKNQFTYKGEDIDREVRQLNKEAEFGEQYRAIQGQNGKKDKIVVISKFQNILPFDLIKKCQIGIRKLEQSKQYTEQRQKIITKNIDYFTNGQPIPDQLAEAFGLQKNSIIDFQQTANQLFEQLNITKKDLQKLMNLKNYSERQIASDVQNQMKITKIREKISAKQASDYSRDPSDIKVKDKKQRAVVSKFRQI